MVKLSKEEVEEFTRMQEIGYGMALNEDVRMSRLFNFATSRVIDLLLRCMDDPIRLQLAVQDLVPRVNAIVNAYFPLDGPALEYFNKACNALLYQGFRDSPVHDSTKNEVLRWIFSLTNNSAQHFHGWEDYKIKQGRSYMDHHQTANVTPMMDEMHSRMNKLYRKFARKMEKTQRKGEKDYRKTSVLFGAPMDE